MSPADNAAQALACTDLDGPPPWFNIRSVSDPQMTGADLTLEKKAAGFAVA